MEKTQNQKVVEPKVVQQVEKLKKISTPKLNKPAYKDKLYNLIINATPIAFKLKSKNILWFDEEKGYEREIKYCENQKTIFVDEMQGPQRLAHITFRDGILYVQKEKQILQKFLEYHPDNGVRFQEEDPAKDAENDLDYLELELNLIIL